MSRSIYDVKDDIETLLRENKELRDNDDLLYLELLKLYNPDIENVGLGYFLRNRSNTKLPPFETVRRARQKIQAENEDLKGIRTEARKKAEEKYLEFARS
jgi:hypothetical protein